MIASELIQFLSIARGNLVFFVQFEYERVHVFLHLG